MLACEDPVVSLEAAGWLDCCCVAPPLVGAVDSGLVATAEDAVGVESVVLVCAPPLLLTVTPEPTWVDDDVVPDVFVVSVAVTPLPVDVDPPLVDVEPAPVVAVDEVAVPVVDVVADPVEDSPDVVLVGVEFAELVEDDPEDVPVVSAAANP